MNWLLLIAFILWVLEEAGIISRRLSILFVILAIGLPFLR